MSQTRVFPDGEGLAVVAATICGYQLVNPRGEITYRGFALDRPAALRLLDQLAAALEMEPVRVEEETCP